MGRRYTRKKNHRRKKRFSKKIGGQRAPVLQFFNWWGGGTPHPLEKEYFESLIKGCTDKYDEVHIHATMSVPENRSNGIPEPKNAKSEKILRIQYAGEGSYGYLDKFDIKIVPGDHPDSPDFIVSPFMHFFIVRSSIPMKALTEKRVYSGPKEKFCIFSVSNPGPKERVRCFEELSKYKKVDSCGKAFNNMGVNCPGSIEINETKEYIDFLSKYKFVICFENTIMKNYMTEKLCTAYLSGAIPIYWGCPNTADYINMDAIVYLKPDFTDEDFNALIEEVKALDQDESRYRKKFEQPLFKGGAVPPAFDMDALNKKVCAYVNSKK